MPLMLLPSLWLTPVWGQETNAEKTLPVKAVTLFSSGVSFTLREGEVEGNTSLPLSFRTAQINDILKSLVLLDDKGTVQPVVYGAKDPISRTLQSFAVDVTQPLSRAELLNRLRGRNITVYNKSTGTEGKTGQIVGVETKMVPVENKEPLAVEILSLLTKDDLEWFRLEELERIHFADERINKEFREALTLLATAADDRKRQVQVRFSGQGKRRVRVGYVSESPLWKISYRLLIGGENQEKPFMQGWALVENTTEEDWVNIRLSLVSGQPISFIQDLYQPLYLPRPMVPLDIVASPYPQLAGGTLADKEDVENLAVSAPAEAPVARKAVAAKPSSARAVTGRPRGETSDMAIPEPTAEMAISAEDMESVQAQATGEQAGELFQYNITTPVSLPRQQAAMIPVISQAIGGEKVSLYNADSLPKHPLNAVRLKNNTPLHLKAGAVTVFDGGVYAGDARMEDIPPGDTRLITYAVDLAVEGERQEGNYSSQETAVTIKKGVLNIARKERRETKYVLKNKADSPRTVLVEHPFEPEYTLVAPKEATERTRDRYRFQVVVPAEKSGSLAVVQERLLSEGVALLEGDLTRLEYYATRKEAPAKLKTALEGVVTRRRKVLDLRQELAQTEAEIKSVDQDQDRIRKNMASLDRNSTLYKRYVQELDDQETKIQSLRQKTTTLRSQITTAEKELRAYIDSIVVE